MGHGEDVGGGDAAVCLRAFIVSREIEATSTQTPNSAFARLQDRARVSRSHTVTKRIQHKISTRSQRKSLLMPWHQFYSPTEGTPSMKSHLQRCFDGHSSAQRRRSRMRGGETLTAEPWRILAYTWRADSVVALETASAPSGKGSGECRQATVLIICFKKGSSRRDIGI